MIRLIILCVFFFGGFGYILFQIFKFYSSLQGSRSQIIKDIDLLNEKLASEEISLVTLAQEELKLLSISELSSEHRSLNGKMVIGRFLSIYNEPLFSYGIKDYSGNSRLIIIVQSADFSIRYECDKEETSVYWDDKPFGKIDTHGELWSFNKNVKLGSIETSEQGIHQSIMVDDRLLAKMNNPYQHHNSTSRAFAFLSEMDQYDRHICLSLAMINLIQRTDIKKIYS